LSTAKNDLSLLPCVAAASGRLLADLGMATIKLFIRPASKTKDFGGVKQGASPSQDPRAPSRTEIRRAVRLTGCRDYNSAIDERERETERVCLHRQLLTCPPMRHIGSRLPLRSLARLVPATAQLSLASLPPKPSAPASLPPAAVTSPARRTPCPSHCSASFQRRRPRISTLRRRNPTLGES
jgi:hypothetical protein